MDENKKEETFTVKKSTAWMIVSFVFIGLFIASVLTSGFRGSNSDITGNPVIAPQGNQGNDPNGNGVINSINLDDDPKVGSKNAKINFIEFSDFQCPFCRRFYEDSLIQLEKEYIDTGKILFVFKDFPLPFHEGAQDYAESAECANEQGKWKEMHDKIFNEQAKSGQGTVPYPGKATVKQWAKEIKLDSEKFDSCFDSGKYAQEVQKDLSDGESYGVSGTPSFFVGNDKTGYTQIVGAQPYPAIKQVIDEALSKA